MLRKIFLVSLIGVLASGCADSDLENATGKATLRAVNGIVGAPDVVFKIEERSIGAVSYAASTQVAEYDDLNYTFNFDLTVSGSGTRRLASIPVDVIADTEYLFVLTGTLNAPAIVLHQDNEREWDGTETVFELGFAHHHNSLGPIDVYFDLPGTDPVIGSELGTLGQGERLAPQEFAAGEYVLTLTAAGDPDTVHFSSTTRAWASSTRDTVVILDRNPSRTSPVTVSRISGTGNSSQLADARFPPQARILHAAFGVDNVDLAENSDFDALLAGNLPFSEITADTDITTGTNLYTFTDAGNPGASLAEREFIISGGTYRTLILTGPAGEPDIVANISRRRPFETSGRIGFFNVASAFELVDVYLLEDGQTVDERSPVISLVPFKTPIPMGATVANDYDLVITVNNEKTILAGPVDLPVANGDVIDVLIMETGDPNVADIKVIRYTP